MMIRFGSCRAPSCRGLKSDSLDIVTFHLVCLTGWLEKRDLTHVDCDEQRFLHQFEGCRPRANWSRSIETMR
jgi:hypothetical protein